ncbi:MAG: hypothetical protein OXG35_26760, partial [Acidobacteria bacterium]|nr:hypothetical protein [Acidobacteriota bacterium]
SSVFKHLYARFGNPPPGASLLYILEASIRLDAPDQPVRFRPHDADGAGGRPAAMPERSQPRGHW